MVEDPPVVEEDEPASTGIGTICVMAYDDINGDGIRALDEAGLEGVSFAVNTGGETVGTFTTSATEIQHCFSELTPGEYTVSWTGANLTATTDQTWSTTVEAGGTVSREFGAQSTLPLEDTDSSISGPNGEREAGRGIPNWLLALLGALGAMFILAGIGVGIYFVVIRRQRT